MTFIAAANEPGRGWTTHAVARASERFGIAPDEFQWRQTLLDIIDAAGRVGAPRAILLRCDQGMEHWACRLAQCAVVAVYHPGTACIVTLIPFGRKLAERHVLRRNQRDRRKDPTERYAPHWWDE